jgi:choline dehydrogenase
MYADGFDYIVVGAGSAGCAIANRLSADPACRVLLVESGPRDRSWKLRMPIAARGVFRGATPFAVEYLTEAQPHLGGRRIAHPRGRVLGGSSSVNGMVFATGHPGDYDDWAANGAQGWRHEDVAPVFKRLENFHGPARVERGREGPVHVHPAGPLGDLAQAFLQAGREAGHPFAEDINGASREGFCAFDVNVNNGVRASAAQAYLDPVRARPNLTVLTGALVARIVVAKGRAIGIEVGLDGVRRTITARHEIVVSCGAFASPQLLLLSGIGPADALARIGVAPTHDLPGVGENLHDHLHVGIQFETPLPVAYNGLMVPHRMLRAGAEWFLFKRGIAAKPVLQTGAFLRSRPELARPDLQFHFFPVLMRDGAPVAGRHGYKVIAETSRPKSRGRLRLRSSDPAEAPAIDPAYLSNEDDRGTMRRAFEMAMDTMTRPAFAPYRARLVEPAEIPRSPAELDSYIARAASTSYHPCGTCRMGEDAGAVVDSRLRVRGIDALRVADASIMPTIASSNLNAPTMMIGERAADFILGTRNAAAPAR